MTARVNTINHDDAKVVRRFFFCVCTHNERPTPHNTQNNVPPTVMIAIFNVLPMLTSTSLVPAPSSSAWDHLSAQGTTCQNVIDSAAQVGCLSSKNDGVVSGEAKTLVTKFASYYDDWSEATSVDTASGAQYQSTCDLPVVVDMILPFSAEKYHEALQTNGMLAHISNINEWIHGYIPSEYALMSTSFVGLSSYTASGSVFDMNDESSVPREAYVNIVFDTSNAAFAWLQWRTSNMLRHENKYQGVDMWQIFDLSSTKTRFAVTGMCASQVNALTQSNNYNDWDFSSLTKWSAAVPLRKVSAPLIDMALSSNSAQFTKFDHWEDTTSDLLPPSTEFSTFGGTCKAQVETAHLQCRLTNARTSLASQYVTNHGASPNLAPQSLSCDLPVAVLIQVPINVTHALAVFQGPEAEARSVLIEKGCGFIYSSVPARHGLISSIIGGSSTFNNEGTSIYTTSNKLLRDIRLTLSFHNSMAAYVWLAWFATFQKNYGQTNGGVRYDPAFAFGRDSRIVVQGMCADSIQQLKEQLGSTSNFLDFAYPSSPSTVRPTGNYKIRPDGWK